MKMILEWYRTGGPFIAPLILVGIAGILLLAERVVHIVVRSKIHARPFMERVLSLVRAGKIDEALKICAENQAALPDLGLIILRSKSDSEGDLRDVARVATLSVGPELTRRLAWLPAIAWVSILLGVVGGIANMHEALTRSAAVAPQGGAALYAGIAYALRPLGAGLLTAIPLVLGHAYLVNETRWLIGQLEEFSARLVSALSDRPDVRLGHR